MSSIPSTHTSSTPAINGNAATPVAAPATADPRTTLLMSLIARHLPSVRVLSVVAAELRLQQDESFGSQCEPAVRAAYRDVLRHVEPSLVDDRLGDLPAVTADNAVNLIRFHLNEALDAVEHAARPAEWKRDDAALMDTIGRVSRQVVHGTIM